MAKKPKPRIKGVKGVVKHTLIYKRCKPTKAFRLLEQGVLAGLAGPQVRPSYSVKTRTLWLKKMFRIQYLRVIAQDPEQRLAYVYRMNCRPPGFHVQPRTIVCNRPQLCPWCYVRDWLMPVVQALLKVPEELRAECRMIGWRRKLRFREQLPFFRANYGPHQWCRALVSAQIVLPWVPNAAGQATRYHFGLQLVPKDCDYRAALTRRSVRPGLRMQEYGTTPATLVQAVAKVTQVNWLELCQEANVGLLLRAGTTQKPRQRLLRINHFKSTKEISDGHSQPSLPED